MRRPAPAPAVIVRSLRLPFQRLPLAFGLVVLPHQRLALAAEITDSGFGQLHRRFLAGHQFTQIGDLRLTLLRGAAQLVQRLPGPRPAVSRRPRAVPWPCRMPVAYPRPCAAAPAPGRPAPRRVCSRMPGSSPKFVTICPASDRLRSPANWASACSRSSMRDSSWKVWLMRAMAGLGLGAQRLHLFDADLDPGPGRVVRRSAACAPRSVPYAALPDVSSTRRRPSAYSRACASRRLIWMLSARRGDTRLSAERSELTADLAEQVVQSGQVGFGVRQLAQRHAPCACGV